MRILMFIFIVVMFSKSETIAQNIPWHDIVINELVASNDSLSGIADQSGKFEDWIELYNNTSSIVDLSEVYLSDKTDDIQLWKFPEGTEIAANGFLLIWADNDEEEPGIHTNFKLKKAGEQLFLTNVDGSYIDSLSFEEQETNVSYARRPNGTGEFIFQPSTFFFNNDMVSTDQLDLNPEVTVFPNPLNNHLNITVENRKSIVYNISVFSREGRLVESCNASTDLTLDCHNWVKGVYTLVVNEESSANKTAITLVKL